MKKEYTKPFIIVESFQLNAAVAASCSSDNKIAINYGENTCDDLEETGASYFGAACSTDVTTYGGDNNDTFCYHGPFDPYAVYLKS